MIFLVVILLITTNMVVSQRTALWITTGGRVSSDRRVRFEYPANDTAQQSSLEALCYIGAEGLLPSEQQPDANGAYPLLCVAATPTQSAPPNDFIDAFESAGGRLPPFFVSRFGGVRARVSNTLHSPRCALATGDWICAQEFGSDFALGTASRGFFGYCGNPPEPSGSRVFVRLDPGGQDPSLRASCGSGAPRSVPVDECWDANPCANPLDCFDDRKQIGGSARCNITGDTTQHRTSFFNRCVSLVGNDVCVEVYSGKADPGATDDGECAFGAKVTRNEEVVFEREIDLGLVPYACARFESAQFPDAVCETCVELRDVEHYTVDSGTGQPTNARGCVEVALACNGVPLARAQVGCVESAALTRCEQSLARQDNSSDTYTPPNSRCARPTPLSPRVCLQLNTSATCDITASILSNNASVYSRVINAADLLSVENRSDTLVTVLKPRTLCVDDARLPCQSCVEWRPSYKHANETPDPTDSGIVSWGACASINVTCLEEPIVDADLGCFDDQPIPSQCFDACKNKTDCGAHGDCQRGICACDATWHGAKCSYQCPGDCSGAARGVCLPTGICACIPPAIGANCSQNLFGLSFGPAPTRRPGNNSVDKNPGDWIPATLTNCPSDCNRRGDCIRAVCACYDGFAGDACEVVTSGGLSGGSIALIVMMIVVGLLVIGVVVYAARVIRSRDNEAAYARLKEDDQEDNIGSVEAAKALKSKSRSRGTATATATPTSEAEMTTKRGSK
jgi:hypothetical protein